MAERTLETPAEDIEQLDEPVTAMPEPGRAAATTTSSPATTTCTSRTRSGCLRCGPYLRELRRRREFALTLSRTKLRAKHFDTALGQVWLVLTPLLMACVYFMLVMVIRGGSRGIEFFAHLSRHCSSSSFSPRRSAKR